MQFHHYFATQLDDLCSRVIPSPVLKPRVELVNESLALSLGIDPASLETQHLIPRLFDPAQRAQLHSVAQKYGGHQFGHWNPQLGDGRGLLLGEVLTPNNTLIDLHLKGAGPTPYSRHADGRAVLRSTIREYLAGEALHALDIPSSRSLCLIASDEPVRREIIEPGAMMIRTCPSHIRFGHFEYFHHSGEKDKLDKLFDFCFEHHFKDSLNHDNPHLAMLEAVIKSTALLVAKWQAYGFNHGVMNTDNMSIHGITFDYGPYAFLDDFIPNYICNHSDHGGRYAFDQQPSIALWNLNALAHGFSQYIEIEDLRKALGQFEPQFISAYQTLMHQRLGFSDWQNEATQQCVNEFMQIIKDEFADYHIVFRQLSKQLPQILHDSPAHYAKLFKQEQRALAWCEQYANLMQEYLAGSENHMKKDAEAIQELMKGINPQTVLRNHHLQRAIVAAEKGDFSICKSLLAAVSQPFDVKDEWQEFAEAPSEADKGIALSCSS